MSIYSIWCLGISGIMAASDQSPAPKLDCKKPAFDFGERENCGEIEHTFVIHNSGNLTLQIYGLRSTCGCLAPRFTDRLVPPNGTVHIPVKFILRGRQGPQKKFVYVESNDPTTPSFPLCVEGMINDPLELRPTALFFGRITTHTSTTGTLMLVTTGTNVLGRVSAHIDSPSFVVKTFPSVNNKSVCLNVISKPPLPEGLTRAALHISTGHARVPTLTTVISAFVPGEFSIVPPELLLVGQEGDIIRREVVLRSESNLAFRVLTVEPPIKDLLSAVSTTTPAGYQIEFPKIPVQRQLDGQAVRIITDHPMRPEVLIPIRVFIR